jgi:ATPase family associated with various cellular activities (AAA)
VTSTAERGAGWFQYLDDRLRSGVSAVAGGQPDADDALRGLYISDDQALALAGELGAGGCGAALELAADRLGLDDLDIAALAVCAAPELHPRYGRLYSYLQDDITRRFPSPRLVSRLLAGDGVTEADVLACFSPTGRLHRAGAIRLLSQDPPLALADRPVKLADRLAAFLLDAGPGMQEAGAPPSLRRVALDPELTGRATTVTEVAEALRARSRLPVIVFGPDAEAVIAAAAGTRLVLLDVSALGSTEGVADATLAAALEGALLCFDGLAELAPKDRADLARAIDRRGERSVLIGSTSAEADAVGEIRALRFEVAVPTYGERRTAWEALAGVDDASEVAAKFRLSIEQIRGASEISLVAARRRGSGTPLPADLDLGARQASSSGLGGLATRLPAAYGWRHLVLPERQQDLLRSISAYLRHRDRVLSDWGYEETVSRTQGLKVLFAGESGTGKTMAAQVLGAELGLEMFRVDLATVVSKYIGETEKNLERIFTAADGSNAILFFDEADALFGKRSEVSDSHDRYANIEVAYLLQRMEAYPGAVILATNFKRNIDDAFVRRLDFVVDFPFPEAEDRRRIWQLVLPDDAPVARDVDLDFLAGQFKLSGGAIRNCSLAAAFRAADEGTEIEMRHLVRGVAQEYAKQGRLTLEADFERFHELVRAPPG